MRKIFILGLICRYKKLNHLYVCMFFNKISFACALVKRHFVSHVLRLAKEMTVQNEKNCMLLL